MLCDALLWMWCSHHERAWYVYVVMILPVKTCFPFIGEIPSNQTAVKEGRLKINCSIAWSADQRDVDQCIVFTNLYVVQSLISQEVIAKRKYLLRSWHPFLEKIQVFTERMNGYC